MLVYGCLVLLVLVWRFDNAIAEFVIDDGGIMRVDSEVDFFHPQSSDDILQPALAFVG